jgi:CheY-like chemotaxis protein
VRAKLVAMSGYGLPEDKARAELAGFHLHLTKPATPEEVLALVADFAASGEVAPAAY